jgi:hypothetical protein
MQGERALMADGTSGSTQVNPKKIYEGQAIWLTTALADAFEAAISVTNAPGVAKEVTATSDLNGLLGGDSLQVYAELQGGEAVYYVNNGTKTIYWRYTLRLTEA